MKTMLDCGAWTIYEGADRMEDRENMKTVEVNGVCLHYAVMGNGRPVVLVHGNGEDHHLFDVEIRQLTRAGYRVFAPDSRGHGANIPLDEYHYADMAEDMYQFIRAMGLEKPAYYGHSDGGIIGLMLEIMHPGTLGIMAVSGTNLSPAGLEPGFVEEFTNINAASPNPLITLMLTEPDISPEALRHIEVPVLVTVGEHDLILSSETERLVSALKHAELITVQGADHGSYVAGSEVMGNYLIRFFADHGYAPENL